MSATRKVDVGGGRLDYYCRACGGYAGSDPFAGHTPEDCIIELRTRLDALAADKEGED